MSEWWDPVEVKEKKKRTSKTLSSGKSGCLCQLIGVFSIVGGCSQMEDMGGYVKGWELWGTFVLIGILLFLVGIFLALAADI